jgi:hypothetical protein
MRIATTTASSFEATLPRGSRAIHVYAVTSVSANQVESAWPSTWAQLIAVATPTLVTLSRPTISAVADAAGGEVRLTVTVPDADPVTSIQLYRVSRLELAASVDTMGPPLAAVSRSGPEIHHVDHPAASWWRVTYRAVSWSAADDLEGQLEVRSPASTAVTVTLAPPQPPTVADLLVNAPGSTSRRCHLSWASDASIEPTPYGPHTVVLEAYGEDGERLVRIAQSLHLVELTLDAVLFHGAPTQPLLAVMGKTGAYRLYGRVPRPAGGGPITVTITMVDPFGRIGSVTETVPELPLIPVPDVLHRRLGEAAAAIQAAQLIPAFANVALVDQTTAIVVAAEPPTGTLVEVGTTVTLEPVDAVHVPDVLGWPVQSRLDELRRRGLVADEVAVALYDWDSAVVSQLDPGPGTAVPAGAHVFVTPMDANPPPRPALVRPWRAHREPADLRRPPWHWRTSASS